MCCLHLRSIDHNLFVVQQHGEAAIEILMNELSLSGELEHNHGGTGEDTRMDTIANANANTNLNINSNINTSANNMNESGSATTNVPHSSMDGGEYTHKHETKQEELAMEEKEQHNRSVRFQMPRQRALIENRNRRRLLDCFFPFYSLSLSLYF
ncbi:kelch motif containing protein, partial [Reticulomyxa filosa]